jgi:prepilin-type N-terminal cleavage/methylation domain-containing protein
MERRLDISSSGGFSLLEIIFVLGVLGICLALGVAALGDGLSRQEARGAAQDWQAAAAWGQVGVLWQGGSSLVGCGPGYLAVSHEFGLCGGSLGAASLAVPVTTNLARWRDGQSAKVDFGGVLASPDGGGSLYFNASRSACRVVVRPESGLTVRSWVDY